MPSRSLLAAITALLLTACGGATGPTAPVVEGDGTTTDPAGSWVLVQALPEIDVPGDARVTMDVVADGDAWQVGGTSACNAYGGRVSTDGGTWSAEGFGQTDMGCDEPRMAAERAYLDALAEVAAWARPSADELVLTGPDVELRFDALPPVPTADLTATIWVLDGLMTGTGPEATTASPAAAADDATLRLESDGTVEASTGCRTFSGEWIETGDEVLFTTFGQRDDSPNVADDGTTTCSPDVVEQENHVLSALGDGFRAEVDGLQLTLISRDGLGLTYRAADG
ncbi:MAG: META domain-containing protein [Nitriliruptoraceae bacterium]